MSGIAIENASFLKKYQPRRFKDFDHEHYHTKVLKMFIEMDSLNLLIIGNGGSGRTTLIEAIMREYYQMDKIPHENVLYINNINEQGIRYYRNNVKTFCQTKGTLVGKKKMLILDDIDMVDERNQQVFRNFIDKYSNNVNFLASCSNNQKVIDSIQSRCSIIKINPTTHKIMDTIYQRIASEEKLVIEEEAKEFILKVSNQSIRLLLNYLEKIKLYDENINILNVKDICTNISFHVLENYTNKWYKEDDLNGAINIIFSIQNNGYSVMDILDSYILYIKFCPYINEEVKYKIIKVICKYISIFYRVSENEIQLAFFTNEIMKQKKK